ncbi:MAG: ribulose-phosphate 3-epimerase [Acidimicrobiia bacterium]|nr:ribulose-phosphate 3-epimerase [Acidimicrobiia bacterium]
MAKPARIAASILNADFARLGEELGRIEPYLDFLHLDIMDGHFVPNLSYGPPVIASLRHVSRLFFDAHLMVTNPMALFEALAKAGANSVTVHIEVYPDPARAAAAARDLGLQFGLVLNPPTPFAAVAPFLELCDLLLVMSVNPGFGGQGFIPEVLEKVEAARKLIDSRGLAADIEIDGGITPDTARLARRAGADAFVAGTAVVRAPDPVGAVEELRAAVRD